MDQSDKASNSKRQADSQPSQEKKLKHDSNENEKFQRMIDIVIRGNYDNSSDRDFFEAEFPHLSDDEILKMNQAINKTTGEKTNESSKETVCSQQQIRSFWKQALLYKNKLRDKFNFTERPVVYDDSLINKLNDDCFAQIFMYLPPEERLKMATVCRQWKRAVEYAWSDIKKLNYNYSTPEPDRTFEDFVRRVEPIFQLNTQMILYSGRYLEELGISYLPLTELIQTIKFNCTNLVKLQLIFPKVHVDEDCNDMFRFMPELKSLEIKWIDDRSMPVTFIESLNRVTDSLEDLKLIVQKLRPDMEDDGTGFYDFPELWISTFRRFESLRILVLEGYNFDDELIGAISEKRSLVELSLNANINADITINVDSISSLENLELLQMISFAMTDYFLINLANNSKNLKYLTIHGSRISDVGIIPLTELKKLEKFEIVLDENDADDGTNEINVTDKSIGKFKNMKRMVLMNCTKITDHSIIKILQNCPDLEEMVFIDGNNITHETFKEAARITRDRKNNIMLRILTSFEMIPEDVAENPDYMSPWLTVSVFYF